MNQRFGWFGRVAITVLLMLLQQGNLWGQEMMVKHSLSFRDMPIQAVFDSLAMATHCKFIYNHEDLPKGWRVTYQTGPQPLARILRELLAGRPLQFTIHGQDVNLQPRPLKLFVLQVMNERGEPLAGVTVRNQLTDRSGITEADGRWQYTSWQDSVPVALSHVGYEPVRVTVRGQQAVGLVPVKSAEEEVVKTGYGSATRRSLIGSISRVTAKDIAGKPFRDVTDLLRQAVGLLITNKTDIPWGGYAMEIRGSRTIEPLGPNRRIDEPLIIVNGVPCLACIGYMSQLSSATGDPQGLGAGLAPLGFQNVEDIESVEVLKDGLATAIYGARGAHGVILITLKQPVPGTTRLSGYVKQGFTSAYRLIRPLTTPEYFTLRREAFAHDQLAPTGPRAADLLWDSTRYTNWAQWLYGHTGHSTTAQVSASNGNRLFDWMISLNHSRDSYVYPAAAYDQWSRVYVAAGYTSRNTRLHLHVQGWLSLQNNRSPGWDLGPLVFLYPHLPALTDGQGQLRWEQDGLSFINPLGWLKNQYAAQSNHSFGTVQVNYRASPALSFKLNLGAARQLMRETTAQPIASAAPGIHQQGLLSRAGKEVLTWIAEPQADWTGYLGPVSAHLTLGCNFQETKNRSVQQEHHDYADDDQLFRDATRMLPAIDTAWTVYRLHSVFGRLHLDPGHAFLFELAGRADASSRFARARRWGFFGAVGGAWLFSETRFARKHLPWLRFGKLRISHGLTGSDQVADYAYKSRWESSPVPYPYGLFPGLVQTQPLHSDLRWQTSHKSEAGVALAVGKLQGEVVYYHHRHRDQIVSYPLPAQSGFTSAIHWNFPAVVDNYGWEFSLGLKTDTGRRARVLLSLSYVQPKTKLRSFTDLNAVLYGRDLIPGHALSARRMYHATGVHPATGLYTVENMDGQGKITPADAQVIKDLDIQGYGHLQGTVQVGPSWAMSFLFEGRVQPGYSSLYYAYQRHYPGQQHASGLSNQGSGVLDRWQGGVAGAYQRLSTEPGKALLDSLAFHLNSDAVITDQSYVALRQLSVEYRLPRGTLHKLRLADARFFVQAQNLFVLSPYQEGNPLLQQPYAQPVTRTLSAGLQVSF